MARVHAPKRGSSQSTRPVTKRAPSWCSYRPEEVESLVIKLAREGQPADMIGGILRDQYGIPLVKAITGKKINQILEEAKLTPQLPEDLAMLLKKASRMQRHVEKNKADRRSIHNLQLLESRIHNLSVYYKKRKLLPEGWKYKSVVGSFI
ncbi:MAG: 30S ribosomal protein S15 [Candidatus Bathyarchaeia archaeon]